MVVVGRVCAGVGGGGEEEWWFWVMVCLVSSRVADVLGEL